MMRNDLGDTGDASLAPTTRTPHTGTRSETSPMMKHMVAAIGITAQMSPMDGL